MLTLTPNPTFKLEVNIPVPGGRKETVQFEFKYQDRDQYKEFLGRHSKPRVNGADVDVAPNANDEAAVEIIAGWRESDVGVPFNEENLRTIFKKYHGASYTIVMAYCADLEGRKLSN